MSRDNWERLVRAVLRRQADLELCFAPSPSPSFSSTSSDLNSRPSTSSRLDENLKSTRKQVEEQVNMAETAVSFLLDQLSNWLHEQRLPRGVEQEVKYIRDELGQMREFLRAVGANEESNSYLTKLVGQVQEICYDVEDVLDKYMLRFGRHRDAIGLSGRIKKVHSSLKNLKAQRQIASQIKAIKNRLGIASKSQQGYIDMYAITDHDDMYAITDHDSSSTIPQIEWYDGRADALFLEEDDVVGIEEPKEQLLEWIWSMDVGLEVISVVGMVGLGKTTLVEKVYDDESVKKHFNLKVWIVVSDYRDVKQLLENLIFVLLQEIKKAPPQELEGMSVDEMRNFVYQFLREKNYIIVLDDVRDTSTWEVIKPAFPKRGVHGCIIMTTRFNSIGNAACSETNHVYSLEPLPIQESRELFYREAFPRGPCPNYLRVFADNILKICEGLPLAIVVIGALLATKNNKAEEWEKFNRNLSQELADGSLKKLWNLLS